jgi:CRP-like cAMP-binding protein
MRQNAVDYFSPSDWALLAARSERMKFSLGEEIIHAGSRLHELFVIRKGSASVEVAGAYSAMVLATLFEGDVCGELAFLSDGISTASVVAKDVEVEVDAFNVYQLRELCEEVPGFGLRLYRFLGTSLAQRVKCTSSELIRALNRSNGSRA